MSKAIPTIRVVKRKYTEQPLVVELYLLFPYKKEGYDYDELFGFGYLEVPWLKENFNSFHDDIENAIEVYLLEKANEV